MNPQAALETINALDEAGINFVACLPDSAFKELYEPLSKKEKLTYIQVANEGDGVGICMGAWLGGYRPALIMENTGLALACYALLRGPIAFGIPMLLLVAHRGGFHDERWFSVPFGWATTRLLEATRVNHQLVLETEEIQSAVVGAVKSMNSVQAPVSVVLGGSTIF